MYDGVVVLDEEGEAVIELPDWFGAVNRDFRYQLTSIGAPGSNLYIAEGIFEANTTTAVKPLGKTRTVISRLQVVFQE